MVPQSSGAAQATARQLTHGSPGVRLSFPMARVTHLECTKCGQSLSADTPQTVCPHDGGVLYARYDLSNIRKNFSPAKLTGRTASMWRYAEVLPDATPVSLGEGFTPMLASREYPNVYVKDEGLNPTGSFKARGLSAAVTMAKHYGLKKLAIPSAGNAAGALAAYAAAAGIEAHIFMPKDVPIANRIESQYYGAHVALVDGLISDCARMVAERKDKEGWFDISTLKEPFRVEGKKTMGYEVAEQLNWRMPHGIIYPTGGGVGMIGMWKAFDEMEKLGWIGAERPKIVSVQAAGCAPIVKAWDEGSVASEMWKGAATQASGLRVPKPYGDYIILDILRKSKGVAIVVTDDEIMDAVRHWAQVEGIFAAPEGAAALASYRKLRASGFFSPEDVVVLFNTGTGLKYLDMMEAAEQPANRSLPTSRHIAGIIGPY
jgi:threonine synthase